MPTLATNKRATFDYEILKKYEAGLVLAGYETKAVKSGRMSLRGSYVVIKNNEAHLINAHISPYQPKNMPADYEPTRARKLLLHKSEIKGLIGESSGKGLTLVPLSVYTNRIGKIKLSFAQARGKKKYDKREAIAEKESKRKIQRALRSKL
ncbi:SsrA-binding protein SmpB [Patescibacteria group bacterium]|nr:SsrA-binding protein SmpB [Patescibacteria group bacterium]MBU3999563.1 SsrA-binding protein SmpB [Patescibacteria group bacterium]MBU4057028.1 SsrA-binding protein SmpB [Patescibacteria group bacterium]MBU4368594.1 SsrA-binding protein SmpB [Patescibacteria group bacterium]